MSADKNKGSTECLCNYKDHKPQTLVTSILEGVRCVESGGIDLSALTIQEVQTKAARENPFQVVNAQCNETEACLGLTSEEFGSCQPLLPVPAFPDTEEDDKLFLYPMEGTRALEENKIAPCDCQDNTLYFTAFPVGAPDDVCHDTRVGWVWNDPVPGTDHTLPIIDPGPEIEVSTKERVGSPCTRQGMESNLKCGIESRSPPDSVPVGEACKNSMPFLERLSPGQHDYDLNAGLTQSGLCGGPAGGARFLGGRETDGLRVRP